MTYDPGVLTPTPGAPAASGARRLPGSAERKTQALAWLRTAVRLPGSTACRRDSLIVFCAAFAYLCLFAGVLQRIGDEGTLVYGAARVAAGAVPYRDFADLANPLSFYWLGAWFAVFGTHLAVARLLLVLTGACISPYPRSNRCRERPTPGLAHVSHASHSSVAAEQSRTRPRASTGTFTRGTFSEPPRMRVMNAE